VIGEGERAVLLARPERQLLHPRSMVETGLACVLDAGASSRTDPEGDLEGNLLATRRAFAYAVSAVSQLALLVVG